ncbi:MAG TPA: GlmU family protein [Flavobacteriaceae bacterium]|nr:GlmU family protein [Flavobacteriaceae bacterium]
MNYILYDSEVRDNLLPLTYTRPVADLRIGILTIREKWEKLLQATTSTKTEEYLSEKFPLEQKEKNIFINASFLPSENLARMVSNLKENQAIFFKETPIAYFYTPNQKVDFSTFDVISYSHTDVIQITQVYDLFSLNEEALKRDFAFLTKNRKSQPIPDHVFTVNDDNIFIEEGATLLNCSLNASDGPIYIGADTTVMEGVHIRGAFALCEHAMVKMGAKIYGATTIGPHSRVGGEVTNSVFIGYSNKGHDGFLGNSVLGEWCNIGADSNNSNLKNNYASVRLWNYPAGRFLDTQLQFCGLIMGDHSKCGINTMFNTGTVVGVSANIYGSGFPRNFIPSFSWGGASGVTTYKIDKVFEVADVVMKRRNVSLEEVDKKILNTVFELTKSYRG